MSKHRRPRTLRGLLRRRPRPGRWIAGACALLLVAVTAGVVLPEVTSAPAASAAPVVTGTGTSGDGRITLTVTSSAQDELPARGATVILTYTVTNNTDQPAYYRSLTDTACSTPGYAANGGMRNDGSRWWIPAGKKATFTCGFLVTQDVNSTATATFDTASSATSPYTTSTATATTPIGVADDQCKDIWYSAENAPTTGSDPTRLGTIGTVAPGTTTPYTRKWTISEATGGAVNGSSAFAIDPTSPLRAYFIGNLNGNLVGLYSIDLRKGQATRIGAGLTAATTTYRLAGAKDGTLWSWATDGNLYSMAAGSTAWVRHQIASVKDVKGQTLATTSLQSGDLAVGGNGNLWLLGADQVQKRTYLIAVPAAQALPTSTAAINATLVGAMNNPKNGGFYNGIDFGADGHLYASTGPNSTGNPSSPNELYDVDMATGKSTPAGAGAVTNVGSVGDLGSCALPRSELRVLKTVSTATPSVKAGDSITYTVRVANLGKLASVGATVTDAIPANTTYVPNSTTLNGVAVADASGAMPYSATSPPTEVHSGGAMPGVVAAGATAVVKFTVTVNNPLDPNVTKISNQATAVDVNGTVKSDDPNMPGDGDTTDVPIARSGIAVTKSASTTAVTGSGDVTYTFVVTNTGNEPLATVRLTDKVTSNRTGGSDAPMKETACAAPTLTSGSDANGNGLLDLNERWVYTCTEPLAWTTGDPDTWKVHDLATVSGVGTVSGTTPSAPSNGVDVTVNRAPAAIDVRKDAGPVVGPDSENGMVDARYTVTVTNSGQRDGSYGPLLDTPSFPAEAKVVEAKIMAPGDTEYTTVAGAGPFTLSSGKTLAAGKSDEYRVVVRYVWTKTASQSTAPGCAATPTPGQGLYNAASLPGGQETDTSNNAACSAPNPQPNPGITLQKYASGPVDADHSGGVSQGDTMTYTFVVTNKSKTLTLNDIKVDDPKVGSVTCPQSPLAVEASMTCTAAKYELPQADVNAGTITNTATASALPPGGLERVTATDTTTTPLPSDGGLTLTKTAKKATGSGETPNLGDEIGYAFTVKNTGQKTLTNVAVSDSKVGPVTCEVTTLEPGRSTSCTSTKTYTVTDADITAGTVVNVATATAKDPDNKPVSTDASATVLSAKATPAISLTKKIKEIADTAPTGLDAGDLVTYTLTVENTGNVPVRTIYADDSGLKIFGVSCQNELLAPGETTTCGTGSGDAKTLTLPLGQAALDAGVLTNSATAFAYYPGDGSTVQASDTATRDLKTAPGFGNSLALTKKAGQIVDVNGNGVTDADDAIGYAFEVKNTGSQTLDLLQVNDIGLATKSLKCEYEKLRPSETTICISKTGHVLTPDDITKGTYTNHATAQAKDPQGNFVKSDDATATTTIPNEPKIELDKIAGPITDITDTPAGDSRGDTIAYTFRVTNISGVPVTGVTITDGKLGMSAVSCGAGDIAPGASVLCNATATYTLTRADVNALKVENTATAAGTANGQTVTATDTATTSLAPLPSITLEKTHDGGDAPRRKGDRVTYRFTVKNTGAGTLRTIKIQDPRLDIEGLCGPEGTTIPVDGTPDNAPDTAYSLACTLTGTYTVTQADVDGGRVANTATATAKAGSGGTITAEAGDSVPTTDAPEPVVPTPTPEPGDLRLTKTARLTTDKGTPGVADVGDVITYGFVVSNPSGVAVSAVSVTDARLAAAGTSVSCPSGPLAPGASLTCTDVAYTVTAADIAAAAKGDGKLINTATARGGDVTSPPASASVPAAVGPAISLRKTATPSKDAGTPDVLDAGDEITYAFVVTNTGPTPLTGVALTDPLVAATSCPKTELAAGESMTCAAPAYVVTAADAAARVVTNTAKVTATGPGGTTTEASDTAVVGRADSRIDLVKTATLTTDNGVRGAADAGDVVGYSFTVTNPGNVPLSTVGVSDPTLGPVTCPKTSLAPRESMTCTGPSRTVTKADVDAGVALTNTAVATGTAPATTPPTTPTTPTTPPTGGTTVEGPGTAVVPVAPRPVARLAMSKAFAWADRGSRTAARVGDGLVYTFTVVNTGTVPLQDVHVDDARLAALGISVACPGGELAVGASTRCTADRPYRVTAADAQRGQVLNTAVAGAHTRDGIPAGTVPDTTPTSPTDRVKVPVDRGDRPSATHPGGRHPNHSETAPGHSGGTPGGSTGDTTGDHGRPADPEHRMPYTGAAIAGTVALGLALSALGVVLLRARRRPGRRR